MSVSRNRLLASLSVAGLTAVVLPWGGTAHAEDEAAFSGYSSLATATAVKVEIYEPSIPIPATPEIELHFAYSKAVGDSGSTKGRASFVWPGDPVGEGLKTIVEQAGLPPKLGEAGYPLQVNSAYPGGPQSQSDEPAPGSIMRTRSEDGSASAKTGFSPDGEVQDPQEGDGGLQLLQQFGQSLLGQQSAATDESEDDTTPNPPAVPDPLSGLVDLGGYLSTSKSVNTGDAVTGTARAALGEVRLLGGLVTLSGLDAESSATSNGTKGVASGDASYGRMTIAGQKFRFGPDGFDADGAPTPIPALPDDPVKALKALGITLTFPKPTYEIKGDSAISTVAALELQIDIAPLAKLLNTSRINDILGPIISKMPDSAGPLKSILSALGNLAPRFVVTLATARTSVDTVQGIAVPESPVPANPGTGAGGTGTGPGPATGGVAPPTGDVPTGDVPPAAAPDPGNAATPDLVSSTPGLPELFSIPGMLLIAGIAGATLLGSYIRKLGLLALGAGGVCTHGLESGIPDLRKVI
jgi:hypothetical protein